MVLTTQKNYLMMPIVKLLNEYLNFLTYASLAAPTLAALHPFSEWPVAAMESDAEPSHRSIQVRSLRLLMITSNITISLLLQLSPPSLLTCDSHISMLLQALHRTYIELRAKSIVSTAELVNLHQRCFETTRSCYLQIHNMRVSTTLLLMRSARRPPSRSTFHVLPSEFLETSCQGTHG